jgi:hypothetical protein
MGSRLMGPSEVYMIVWSYPAVPSSSHPLAKHLHDHYRSSVFGRVRRIHNFFYALQSESKRIWILFASYSHVSVYSQAPFIRIIRFIFASKYSHKFVYRFSIWCKTNACRSEYSLQSEYSLHIVSCWRIFASKIFSLYIILQCLSADNSDDALH